MVIPIGPDWIDVPSFEHEAEYGDGMTVDLWSSANGQSWTRQGSATWGTVDVGDADPCAEFAEASDHTEAAAFLGMGLTYGCSEGGFSGPRAVTWMSADGITWSRLPFGTHATIGGVEAIGGRHVAATHAGTGLAEDRGVTFWVSDAP